MASSTISRAPLLLLALQALLLAGRAQLGLAAGGLQGRMLRPQEVDSILNNERVFKPYLQCLLEDSNRRCNQDSLELKKALPPALSTGCAKCTPNQKLLTERVVRHLQTRRPRDWERLRAKYDPEGQYEKRYGSALRPPTKAPTATAKSKVAA